MPKKVAILTFHNAHNYGAALQAYGLKRQLEELGADPIVVNYNNPTISNVYNRKLKVNLWKKRWLKPTNWSELIYLFRLYNNAQRDWEKQWDAFKEFLNAELINQEPVSFEGLSEIDADLFLVGSDQVWNRGITGRLDPAYLLSFPTKAQKGSYAASMARWDLSSQDELRLKESLSQFDYISVREEYLSEKISNLLGKKVVTTLDPSLLLDAEQYEPLMSKQAQQADKFVFAYFVTEDEYLMKCAQALAVESGYRLIELHYYRRHDLPGHNQVTDIGPREFLWYMKHAEFVLTNSFHGTVFSILNRKPFYSVHKKGKNNRTENLLAKLGILDRMIELPEQINSKQTIDYDKVHAKLKSVRTESVDFLKNTLQQAKK